MAREIQLVAVQMGLSLDDYWSRKAFQEKIGKTVDAVKQAIDPSVPTLVAYPEDVGLMLVLQGLNDELSHVTTVAEAIARATRTLFLPALGRRIVHRLSWVPALFLTRHRLIAETYFDVFSNAARTLGAYLVAGSVVLPKYRVDQGRVLWDQKPLDPQVYNTAYVFDPSGQVVGEQRKVYLIDLEMRAALDLAAGTIDELTVVETPLGKLGVAICLDSFQDDVAHRLKGLGAQILVQPSANPAPWTSEQQVEWLESAYRRTHLEKLFAYAVNPMMTGSLWDLGFFGQSSIVGQDGVLRQAATADGEEILVVRTRGVA